MKETWYVSGPSLGRNHEIYRAPDGVNYCRLDNGFQYEATDHSIRDWVKQYPQNHYFPESLAPSFVLNWCKI